MSAGEAAPGAILSADTQGMRVTAATGVLALWRLRAEGRCGMDAATFQNGHRVQAGACRTAVFAR